jgi:uncharacterized protein (DUF2237 family)
VQQHHPLPLACVAVAERCDGGAHERSLRCIGGQWAVCGGRWDALKDAGSMPP